MMHTRSWFREWPREATVPAIPCYLGISVLQDKFGYYALTNREELCYDPFLERLE